MAEEAGDTEIPATQAMPPFMLRDISPDRYAPRQRIRHSNPVFRFWVPRNANRL